MWPLELRDYAVNLIRAAQEGVLLRAQRAGTVPLMARSVIYGVESVPQDTAVLRILP